MGKGLQRAFAATARTRITDKQRAILAVMTYEWKSADQIADDANVKGYSPREIAAKVANKLTLEYILEKGGTRQAPRWRLPGNT